MPTITVLFNDLERLVGVKLPKDVNSLNDVLYYVKGEVESIEQDDLSIEIKDGNRPDLWNVEGIARALRGALGVEAGLKEYSTSGYSGIEVLVDPQLKDIRPYIAASVVTGVHLDHEAVRDLMRLQEKLDLTYGRRRRRASIGVYNNSLITPPVNYRVARPTAVSFIPLDDHRALTLGEILTSHPKGVEYGHILAEYNQWPILHDAEEKILSFPPIINSHDLGKVTPRVKDIFVEVTGTVYETVLNTLNIVTLSLADRGQTILSTKIRYPYEKRGIDEIPKLGTRQVELSGNQVNIMLGLNLRLQDMVKLLKMARYDAYQSSEDIITVTVPCYRMDVMHSVDIIEDIAIMYGYNEMDLRWPQLFTLGRIRDEEALINLAREVMLGLGFQEILTFSMSNSSNLFDKMNLEHGRIVEVVNPKTLLYTCLRSWLIPSLLEFLSKNTNAEYPQKIFEVGECVVFDANTSNGVKDTKKLACISIHSHATFSEVKAVLDAFFKNMGVPYHLKETAFDSFITGRVGAISVDAEEIGFLGELNPRVLEMWNLENPAVAFEIDLDPVLRSITKVVK